MRLVSLAPSNTEILYALGVEPTAVTSYCDVPEAAKKLPRLPGWSTIKASDVIALKPDLVLTSSICQESLRLELQAAKVPLHHFDPRTLNDVAESFIEIGKLVNVDGASLATKFRSDLAALTIPNPAKRPRVYIEEWHEPPMVAGNWVPEMLLAAGLEPFNRKLGEPSVAISWEELMEFDPEYVIYSICGVGKTFKPEVFYEVEGWSTLTAAKNKKVISVDDDLFNRPGPRLIEGIHLLKSLIFA